MPISNISTDKPDSTRLPQATLFRSADVFTPDPIGVCDVLVIGERIMKIDKCIPQEGWLDCQSIDVHGKKLIPGLIDGHVHLIGGGGEGGPVTRAPEIEFDALICAGITTAVGVLGFDSVTRHMTSLLAKARALEAMGMTTFLYTGGYQLPPHTITGDLIQDLVLIDKILGAGEIAISDHRSSHPQARELAALAAQARIGGILSGKPGIVHLHLGDGRTGFKPIQQILEETDLPPRQFYPTHVNRKFKLLEEAAEFAKRGGFIDLTASAGPDFGEPEGTTPADAYHWFKQHGVPTDHITISSDANGSLPVFDAQGRLIKLDVGTPEVLWQAIRSIMKADVPLADVLPWVTSNPANILGLTKKGRIQVGCDADLVVLGDEDQIEAVMARGVIYFSKLA